MIQIRLNGQSQAIPDTLSLAELLERFQINPRQVAVAKNLEVIPRAEQAAVKMAEGDEIEVFHAVGGG